MLSLGFPAGLLYDMMMRGGPLPERYESLGRALVNPGQLEFEPEEAVVMREWLQQEPDGLSLADCVLIFRSSPHAKHLFSAEHEKI